MTTGDVGMILWKIQIVKPGLFNRILEDGNPNILLNIDEIILYSRIICQGNPDKAKLSSALRANYALKHNLG